MLEYGKFCNAGVDTRGEGSSVFYVWACACFTFYKLYYRLCCVYGRYATREYAGNAFFMRYNLSYTVYFLKNCVFLYEISCTQVLIEYVNFMWVYQVYTSVYYISVICILFLAESRAFGPLPGVYYAPRHS